MAAEIIEGTVSVDLSTNTLRFRVSAANGDYIKFPQTFASDKVTVFIPNYYDGRVFNTCGITKQAVCDRYGFTLSKLAQAPGMSPYWNDNADMIDVTVIGEGFVYM